MTIKQYLRETLGCEKEETMPVKEFNGMLDDYSFMDELDYLLSNKAYGGHYIKITLRQKDNCVLVKEIFAKTFEELMEKARVWCEENKTRKEIT